MNCILQGQIKGANKELSNLSNYQKALRNIGGRPNRNLLDNWYFVGGGSQQGGGQFPINQRGETSYSTSYGSIFDCWKCGKPGSVITLAHDYLTLNNVGDLFQITQNVDQGEVVTASILATDGLFSGTVTIPVATSENIGINAYQGNGITIAVFGLAGGNVQFSILTDTEKNLIAGKLELGSTQTLAYQDEESNWKLFETPDYAGELARCQRYLLVLPGFNTLFSNIGVGSFFSETEAEITIPTPTTMRIMPTCAATGNWLLRGDGQLINVEAGASNFFAQQMSSNAVSMIINGLSGCPANQATQLLRSNNSTAKITLSAEL